MIVRTSFPFYRTAPSNWMNSVRHVLSLEKYFVKVEEIPEMVKKHKWRLKDTESTRRWLDNQITCHRVWDLSKLRHCLGNIGE